MSSGDHQSTSSLVAGSLIVAMAGSTLHNMVFRFPLFMIICLLPYQVECQNFGDNIDSEGFGGDVVSKNEDNRFSHMGQVTKEEFDISGGSVTFSLNVQDTVGIKEFWIIDFEPYRYNVDQMPVDENTGQLLSANTGPCSNVYEDQDFNIYFSDEYFQNKTAGELSGKCLFNEFTRGTYATELGCFNDTEDDRALPNHIIQKAGILTVDMCIEHCSANQQRYAAVQGANWCLCGASTDDYAKHGAADTGECNQACDGDVTEMCGGQLRQIVYDLDDNRRNNQIIYNGPMSTWFNCTTSDGLKVWQLTSDSSSTDELEYRTTLYAINVRPKDEDTETAGISFVQSSIELIWRLSRTAISKLIISSVALLQPVLEFTRVSAVFDQNGEPVPTQAHLHIRFSTVVDSDLQMVTYVDNSILYIPDSETLGHGLRLVLEEPPSSVLEGPECEFLLDHGTNSQIQCHQFWDFKVILDVDVTGHEDNRAPIDASGVFEFSYTEMTCLNNTGNFSTFDYDSCLPIDDEPAKVALLLTIQTVVFVQDDEEDQIAIMLVALKGADNQELSVEGARGIAHRENVTLEVKFSPAILRADYELDLLLFMVCRGEEYTSDDYPHGCLQAPTMDRYVAHREQHFSYTPRIYNESGVFEETPYEYSHVENDYLQQLDFEGYVEEDDFQRPLPVPVHRSTFVNLALSGASEKYVITNVYKLVEKSNRKRRHPEVIIAKTIVDDDDDALSFFHGHPFFRRYRRDIDDSVRENHGQRYGYTSLGCPPGAMYDRLDCHCAAGMAYSERSFECVIDDSLFPVVVSDIEEKEEETNVIEEDLGETEKGAGCLASPMMMSLMLCCMLIMLL